MNEERLERKLATVLFADLVSSTELGASQDPERTRTMFDRFYEAMADEIARAGGTVEKFAGDAVMAAFGVPVAQEDHVERALHAALAMQRQARGALRRRTLCCGSGSTRARSWSVPPVSTARSLRVTP